MGEIASKRNRLMLDESAARQLGCQAISEQIAL